MTRNPNLQKNCCFIKQKAIGRFVVVPYTMFMEEAKKVADEKKIFELNSIY